MIKRPTSFRILTYLIAVLTICVIVTATGWGRVSGLWDLSPFGTAALAGSTFSPQSSSVSPAFAVASSANYSFATNAAGSLTNMSFGTAQLIAADLDDSASQVTSIGFDFYLMGKRYSQFSVNSNGLLALGPTPVDASAYSVAAGTATAPLISAFGGDLRTGTSGKVHYKVTGSAPNRVLNVEFLNLSILGISSPGTNDGTFQVRLYESSGKVEFVYGSMIRNNGTSANNGQLVGIGFAVNALTNGFVSISSASNSSNVGAPFLEQAYSAGAIANLNSTADGSRRVYSLTPANTATSPTALTFSGVTSSGMTLNWVDAADEVGYAVYRSTDGGSNYVYQGSVDSDVTSLSVTSLQPGETYFWKVYSLSEGTLSASPLSGSQATSSAGTTYYWVGTSGADWNTPASWNTAVDNTGSGRATPTTSDILIVDGAGTTAGAATSISISSSETIGTLRITSNTACTLFSSSTSTRTILISGNAGPDFQIEAGSSLLFSSATNPVGIAFATSTGMTGDIAGTLSFLSGANVSNSLNTTGGDGTVVVVASTGVVDLGVADDSMFVGSADSLFVNDGGTINSSGATTGAPPVPLATWGTTANLNISGLTTSTTPPANNAQAFGNVTYNCPAATGAMNFFGGTTTGSIRGTLTITATNTGRFIAVSGGNVQIGNMTVNGGTFEAASADGGRVSISGNVIQTGGSIDVSSGSSGTLSLAGDFNQTATGVLMVSGGISNVIDFGGSSVQHLSLANTVTGPLNVRINNSAGVDLTGSLSINDNAGLTISSGNVTGSGTITFGSTSSQLAYTGTSPQIATATEFPSASGPVNLVVNNSGSSPNNTVTLGFSRTLPASGKLFLTTGILVNAGNVLTLANTGQDAVAGGSTASFVRGAVARTLPSGLTGTLTYAFPVGKGAYNPFELVNPTTSGSMVVQAEAFDANAGGSPGVSMGSLNSDRYWAASITSGSGLTSSFIRLSDGSAAANNAIAASATKTGVYDIVGSTTPTIVAGTSVTSAAPAATTIPGFYAIGTVDTTPPTITYSPLPNTFATTDRTLTVTLADATGLGNGISSPRIYYKNGLGAYFSNACSLATGTLTNGIWNCTILAADIAPTAPATISYFVIAQDTAGNVLSNPSAGLVATSVNAVATPPSSPNTYLVVSRFSGSINLGSSESITSLTNPGGLFSQINNGAINGDLTVNITSDLTAETGEIALNQATEEGAGNWTITIKPGSGPLVISGSAPACLISLDGADRVVIDGAVSGTSKDTTISNTNTAGATICFANSANNNTLKNLVIRGVSTSPANGVVFFGGTTAATGNSGNSVLDNTITDGASGMARGVYLSGTSGKNGDGNSIIGNVITNFSDAGIYLDNYYTNTSIRQNSISEASTQTSTAITGIYLNNVPTGGMVSRNRIFDLNTSGAAATIRGIYLAGSTSGDVINITNNFLYLDSTVTTAATAIYGVEIAGSSGVVSNLLNNSIKVGGSAVASGSSAALFLHNGGTLNSRNNILFNARSNGTGSGNHFAVELGSLSDLVSFTSDRNDLFVSGTGGFVGTTDGGATTRLTLANWQSVSSGDAGSISADPLFLSPTDLHVQYGSPAKNTGATLAEVTDDIDGDARPKDGAYDIGADEYVDSTAPDTAINSNPANPSNNSSATFTFSASDSLSGPEAVAGFQCKLDSVSFEACTSPKTYNSLADGSHTFYVYAVDASGNADASPAQYTWVIDTVPPNTTITAQPQDPTNSSSATFSFEGTDTGGSGVAGFICQLDSNSPTGCNTGSASYSALGAGQHTFTVFASDNAGNQDATPASYVWSIDLTPPDTTIDSFPPNPTSSTSATFTFDAVNFAAVQSYTFKCSLDGASFATCTSPVNLSGLSDGPHTFNVKATDPAGNEDATPASYTWVVDTVAPDTLIATHPADPTNDTSASFSFTGTDAGGTGVAGFTCKLDSNSVAACNSGTVTYFGLTAGQHTFTVFATDNAGNADATAASFNWNVDLTPPDTTINTFPANPISSSSATFTFDASNFAAAVSYTFKCSLDAAAFSSCTSPVNVSGLSDGSHTFSVRANDPAGNEDPTPASYTWVVDTIVPVATINPPTPSNPTNVTSGSFNFSGTDTGGTGITGFVCSLDGGAFAVCVSPFSFSALVDGAHTFAVKAIDAAANQSTPAIFAWVVDTTPPDTSITGQPSNPTNSNSAIFTFTNVGSTPPDGESRPEAPMAVTFECSLDAAAFVSCLSGINYFSLADGSHTFRVRAIDQAGNVDASPAQYTWVVDTVNPVASINPPTPANPSNSSSATFNFSGTDTGGSGVSSLTCSLDAAAYTACTSPKTLSSLTNGSHTFSVKAVDAAGNQSSPATFTWVADLNPPDTTIGSKPGNLTNNPDATFTFSGSDSLSGPESVASFQCKLDNGSYGACSSPTSYTALADGSHTFSVYAVDTAGNVDPTPAQYAWVIDTTDPDTTITVHPTNPTAGTSANFTFSGSDPGGSGVINLTCKLDANAPTNCTSGTASYTGLASGSHTFSVFSTDNVGNFDATPATFTWVIDFTPPTVTITAPTPSNPSSSASATFTFSGTDTGGSGVTGFQCSLDAAAYSACTSPKVYNGLADGAHSFNVKSVDGAGNQSTPSSFAWTVDTVAPDTSILSGPGDPSFDPDASFTFTNIGNRPGQKAQGRPAEGVSFECKLDGGSFAACTSPQNYFGLADGLHTFMVRAVDGAGNADQTPAVYSWTVSVPAGPVVVFASAGLTGPNSYPTLRAAFDAINSGVHQGTLFINISGNTTESSSAVLNESGSGSTSYTSVLIQPVRGAQTISGSVTGPLLDLNGADNVTIDGRNTGGNSLTLTNSATGSASTLRFINDAINNIVTKTTLRGSATTASGVVYFGTGITTGNSNNNINNCTIAAAGFNAPLNDIYSAGSVNNSQNTITANNIADFFSGDTASNGINLAAGSSAWSITSNKLYQTTPRTYSAGATHSAINIASGSGHTVTGNTIGGSSPNGGGFYIMSGSVATRFVGINLAVGTAPATSVQGNNVASILLATSSNANTASGVLCGLNITSGNVNAGNVTPNVFGVASGTDSLVVTPAATQGAVVGVNSSSTGTVLITNNVVGGLTSGSSTNVIGGAVYGVNVSGDAASITVTGNTIGTADTDSLRAGLRNTTTGSSIAVGISQTGLPVSANYSNNTIQNLSSFGTGNAGLVLGIDTGNTASGSATATISGNTINNLTTNSTLIGESGATISAGGIRLFPGIGSVISANTISSISNFNAGDLGTVVAGISHAAATNTSISGNRIFGLSNASTTTSLTAPGVATGVLIRSGTSSITVFNNMISLGTNQFTNTMFIGIWANHGATPDPLDKIYFNTVNIGGTVSAGAMPTMAFERGDLGTLPRTAQVDLRNNILNNTRTGAFGKHYAISNNFGAPSSTASGWPSNASNSNVLNGGLSTTVGYWSGNQTFAGWKAASASDSFSYAAVPVTFVNGFSDLHLNMGLTATVIESGAQSIAGITTDIDGQNRPGPAGSINGGAFGPDIGADEFDGAFQDTAAPIITYTPLPNITTTGNRTLSVSISDGSGVALGGNAPRIFFKKSSDPGYVSSACSLAGGTSQNGTFNCAINYALVGSGHVSLGETVQYFVVAQDLNGNLTANPSTGFVGTNVISITSPPTPPNSYRIALSYNGSFYVGSGGSFASLTNPGGVFDALNAGVITGNIVIGITSDLTSETGAVALNQASEEGIGGYAIKIYPFGAPRTISGSSATSLIKLNGTDRVTIDGSTTGSTDRGMTISNTGSGAVIWIATNSASGATNNTVKNLVLNGPGGFSGQGIVSGSGTSLGSVAESGRPNSNLTIQNNQIRSVQNAVFTAGDPNTLDQNIVITGNDVGSTVTAEKLSLRGFAVQNAQNFQITANHIVGIASSTSSNSTVSGIMFGGTISGGTIGRNEIRDIKQKNAAGGGSNGILANATTAASNVQITNNFISDIASIGTAGTTSASNGYGIMLDSGAGYQIYHNTVSMNTNQTSAGSITAAINIASAVNAPAGIDLRNNIFANSETVGTRYAIYAGASTNVFVFIDYNDYYAQNVGFVGAGAATLSAWQAATGQDTHSYEVDPVFVSVADLHIFAGSPMIDHAVTLPGITLDYDGDTRPVGIANDIGADERTQGPAGPPARISGRISNAAGRGLPATLVTLTDNTSGARIYTMTNPFGYYVLQSVPTGVSYSITITSKHYYTFTPAVHTFTLTADRPNEDWIADQ